MDGWVLFVVYCFFSREEGDCYVVRFRKGCDLWVFFRVGFFFGVWWMLWVLWVWGSLWVGGGKKVGCVF